MGKVGNFSRFYALFKGMSADTTKEDLVRSFTGDRTESLREMNGREYDAMCDKMEEATGGGDKELRRARSAV